MKRIQYSENKLRELPVGAEKRRYESEHIKPYIPPNRLQTNYTRSNKFSTQSKIIENYTRSLEPRKFDKGSNQITNFQK
jgi:hypothetical protein